MLIGLLDNAQWKNPAFDSLMRKLPRGRADLFNLALGHVSRSFLLWAYMRMTVKSNSTTSTIVSTSSSSTSSTTISKRQFVPTIIPQQQQPTFITEQLSDKLTTAKARLLAAEQEALKAKQQLEQLELEAIRQATTTQQSIEQQQEERPKTPTTKQQTKFNVPHQTAPPVRRHQSVTLLPDILSLSDDDNDENEDMNDIAKRLAHNHFFRHITTFSHTAPNNT